jgi:hypothetical protein
MSVFGMCELTIKNDATKGLQALSKMTEPVHRAVHDQIIGNAGIYSQSGARASGSRDAICDRPLGRSTTAECSATERSSTLASTGASTDGSSSV